MLPRVAQLIDPRGEQGAALVTSGVRLRRAMSDVRDVAFDRRARRRLDEAADLALAAADDHRRHVGDVVALHDRHRREEVRTDADHFDRQMRIRGALDGLEQPRDVLLAVAAPGGHDHLQARRLGHGAQPLHDRGVGLVGVGDRAPDRRDLPQLVQGHRSGLALVRGDDDGLARDRREEHRVVR
jgi:hypothetical protein